MYWSLGIFVVYQYLTINIYYIQPGDILALVNCL
jgi:hypothetical protein